MTNIRPAEQVDLDSLYEISLLTGDAGKDATALYADPRLIGHIYMAPYVVLTPETCFVAEVEGRVCGYVVGTYNTRAFEAEMERLWWPDLRARYPDPGATAQPDWTNDQKRCAMIHHPVPVLEAVVAAFPAHMHLNVHPDAQGGGIGKALCGYWLDLARKQGVEAVHVGVSPLNRRGQAFWRRCGFEPPEGLDLSRRERAVWLGWLRT